MFKNTIIVTANYRLSIFGWLGSDNLRVSRSTHSSHPHSRVHAPTHPRAHTHAKYCARTPLILCFLLEYFSFFLSPPFFVSLFFVSLFSFLFPFLCLFRAFSSSQHTLPPPHHHQRANISQSYAGIGWVDGQLWLAGPACSHAMGPSECSSIQRRPDPPHYLRRVCWCRFHFSPLGCASIRRTL